MALCDDHFLQTGPAQGASWKMFGERERESVCFLPVGCGVAQALGPFDVLFEKFRNDYPPEQ